MADAGESSSATAPELYRGEGERGGGGKLRRERKPPATPYDRPPRTGRWISRFVDPAKRLFSGLPSLFYPVPSSIETANEVQTEEEQEVEDSKENCLVNHVVPKSTVGVDPSEVKGKSKLDITDEDGLDESEGCSGGKVPDIEQIIKGKTFSKEDVDHLMKILHSKVVDAEQGRKPPEISGRNEVEKAETSIRLKTYVDEDEDMNRFQLATSTSLSRPSMQDEIGASPVDIARAYMGSKTSEMGFTPTSLVPKSEKFGLSSDFSSKPAMPSPLQKAPICWPGAVTQNQLNYSTPQTQNNRSGFHSFPRTPYSRTVFSKSKSKLTPLRGDNERFLSVTPAPFQPTATPVYGKSMNNKTEDTYGSGGPVRRMRNKFTSATPSRESTLFRTAQRSPLARESNLDFTPKKFFEPGSSSTAIFNSVNSKAKSPEAGVHSAHPHSSRVARHILEQIDRPITIKQNSEELKLATSWKDSSAAALATPAQNISSSSTAGVMVDKKKNAQTNGQNNVLPQERTNTVTGTGKDIFGSITSLDKRSSTVGASSSLKIFDFQRSGEQGISNDLPKTSLFTGASNKAAAITNSSARPEPQNPHRKPMLKSIAIEKSSMGTSFSSGSGFTFSFNTSSTTSAEPEPPTPSIMPSFLTSSPPQSKVSANSPNKITIAPPVVSFPSKTKAFTPNDDASAPKFKFGSGKTRLSFAVAGDDATTPTPNDSAIPKFKFGSGKSRLNFGSIGSSDALCC
ncbi:nuclear pore complex protein NUP1-like [Chenopodium quinoa]|uniref:nuclear pore complex protein NUP1-like n=1 Tax=Chenopodium quinoa TaxID=63459 RepID=UPI000B76C229|nr:nuclear pore complex protein NUP1-like [Chenopodium quinoa]